MSELSITVDTPHDYTEQTISLNTPPLKPEDILKTVESEEGNFNLQLLHAEEKVLGITFDKDPVGFTDAHNEFVYKRQEKLEQDFPDIAERTDDAVARYLAKGDDGKYAQIRQTFAARIAHTQGVRIIDHLRSGLIGENRPLPRTVHINSFFGLLPDGEGDWLVNNIAGPHERIHSFLTGASTESALVTNNGMFTWNLPSRNGISTLHVPGDEPAAPHELKPMATWVNESFIEDLRSAALGTDEVGYKRGTAVLRTLKQLDPSLGERLVDVGFGPEGPAGLIGQLENILGPIGVEDVQELLEQKWNPETGTIEHADTEDVFVEKVAGLVSVPLQEKARAVLAEELAKAKALPIPAELMSGH